MTPKFTIRTFGCQMNEHDSERLAGLFVADGYEQTDDPEQADVIVLNTCCIRESADNKLYGHLGHLRSWRERHPDAQIAVGGCLAQRDGELLRRRADHVDVVFGTHNLHRAPALVRRARVQGPQVEVVPASAAFDAASVAGPGGSTSVVAGKPAAAGGDTPGRVDPASRDDIARNLALGAARDVPYAAWVSIQTGCNNSCAFCIVPQVRGPEVSRAFDDLVGEVEALASRGVTEVTLLGQNVNSYGRDLTRRRPLFAALLRAVGAVDGIERVRFTSPHPKDLRPETIEAMADTPAVCEHLHLPLQAGSDRVLAAMRRGYTAERYLARLAAARRAVDDLAVSTDIIVGFPGETDDDFARTLEVVAEAGYDSAFTFVFSPRPGTRAAAMEERFVAPAVVAERFERLRAVVERSALRRNRARVGRVEQVLVEGASKRDADMTTGRTRQNKLVHFPSRSVPAGSYATVEVTAAAPHHLLGELVEVVSAPRHPTRIPLAVT